MRQGCMLLSVFCLIGIIACSGEEGHDIQIPDPVICTLNYTIPDTEITVTGNTLTVKAKKSYGDLPAGQAYDDDFYIKVKNLTVHFKLTQVDRSPDDWGNGGTQEDEL